MIRHLLGEESMENVSEFGVVAVPFPRESVCDVIFFPREPLTVSFDACVHKYLCVFSCCLGPCARLDGVDAGLVKIRFLHPAFSRRAVGH